MKKIVFIILLSIPIFNPQGYLDLGSYVEEQQAYRDDSFRNTDSESKILHFVAQGVPEKPLRMTFEYFLRHQDLFENKSYMSILDYSQSSKEKRWYLLNLDTGILQREYVAHGSGRNRLGLPIADMGHDGFLNKCKHPKSARRMRLVKHRRWGMTRPGFIKVEAPYFSEKFAYGDYRQSREVNALLLTGLEETSSDVRKNLVVIHEADYVYNYSRIQGRTLGCMAIPVGRMKDVLPKIRGGSILFNYVPQC